MHKRQDRKHRQNQIRRKQKKRVGELEQAKSIEQQPKQTPYKQQKMEEEVYDEQEVSEGEFQDDFQDEFEKEEEVWVSQNNQSEQEEQVQNDGTMQAQSKTKNKNNKQKEKEKTQIFMGTKKNLKKGQVLDFDNNAYDMLHRLNNQWPALSIDFICQDTPFTSLPKFQQMNKYPYQVYTVQGSCNNTQNNSIYLTKWLKLHKTKYDDDPDVEGDSEDSDIANDQQPEIVAQYIETSFNVNRIKTLVNSPIVGFWNDQGEIHIMDLTKNYQKLKNNIGTKKKQFAKQIILQSSCQGYAINWNHQKIGQLATGNIMGELQIFQNNQSYTSWSKTHTYTYHKSSIQDIVFSPNQPTVFASCSSDGTLQVVDMRVGDMKKSQLCIKAHEKDINVCDWNSISTNLIVTGSDDCMVKVWDLRKQKSSNKNSMTQELLSFNWHTQPITSIKFQPNEQSVIAVASQDNSISIWDMSMENQQQEPQIPNELMFIHQGQQQIKQIRFHPVYFEMIVSSALDGINIFKPSYQMPQQQAQAESDTKKQPIIQQELDLYLQSMKKKSQKAQKMDKKEKKQGRN